MDTFFEIADELLKSAENIHSYPYFANSYREFLIAYPWRYKYTHEGNYMLQEDLIELLDRYETISTFNLVNESLNHKENLKNNPMLVSEYSTGH